MSDLKLLQSYDVFDYTVITEDVDPAQKVALTTDGKLNEVNLPSMKKIILKGILQKADALNQNGRIYPLHILEREVRNYQKFIIENRSLGECVLPGTEIYTRSGWKRIEEIDDSAVMATLNLTTNELEFQRINVKIDLPYTGKMYRFRNARSYDMCLTPNHNVLVWNRAGKPQKVTAKELYEGWQIRDSALAHSGLRRAGATWVGEDPITVSIAGKTIDADLWASFLGIYIAEGHSSGVYVKERQKYHDVVITQNEGDVSEQIRLLLAQLPWQYEEVSNETSPRRDFVITDEALHAHLLVLGGSHAKYIPAYAKNWSPRLLEHLMTWMLMGDGRHRMGADKMIDEYCTTSPQLAEDAYDVMLKLGHGATHHIIIPSDRGAPDFEQTGRMILAENSAPMHLVCKSYSRGISLDFRFMQVSVEDYDGHVYCVNVKNGTWLMRYNGKVCWTCNCDHPDSSVVELKNVSHIVREAHIENGVVYGTVELLNTPSGKILQSLIESKVKLGISSRGVGTTQKQGDYYMVQDDFQLICWDFVSEPSTTGAFMIPEGRSITSADLVKVWSRSDRIDRIINDILASHV